MTIGNIHHAKDAGQRAALIAFNGQPASYVANYIASELGSDGDLLAIAREAYAEITKQLANAEKFLFANLTFDDQLTFTRNPFRAAACDPNWKFIAKHIPEGLAELFQ